MNLRDLQYVLAVSRYGNFSLAAAKCNVSQPALSNQIKKLELELGVDLFLRLPGEVRSTDCGARIAKLSAEVLDAAQKIKDTAAEYSDPEAIPLKLGVTPTLAPYLTKYLAEMIEAIFDSMRVVMVEDLPANMLQQVADHKLDVALLARSNRSDALDFTPIWEEPLMLGMRRGHRLENLASIAAEDVPPEDLIRLPYSFGYDLEARLPHPDQEVLNTRAFDLTAARFETVCRHVSHSDSCTIVSGIAAGQLQNEGWNMSFVPFEGPGNLRCLGAVSRPNCPRKPILAKIGQYIVSHPPKGVTPVFGRDAA